uniref:Protein VERNALIZATION INSENSITIVE 3 n=2 Tax=Anthurium amnicola TaxID=1678845 RepID=A0A1D1ZF45_9ARAE
MCGMDSDGNTLPRAVGSHISSVINTLGENENLYAPIKSQESLQEPFDSIQREELDHLISDKGRTHRGASKSKMDQKLKGTPECKNLDLKCMASRNLKSSKDEGHPRKQVKGENPNWIQSLEGTPPDSGHAKTWVCKNSACKAVLSSEDTFCKRCSCCICHLFDDNKDPSLWLVCASESGDYDSCGLSCHMECAIQHQKAGVVNLGQSLQIDGSYCCASCGKVSGILGSWKKQLAIAKDARRIDVLCYRISLSYRLLDGTSRFKALHDIVRDAKGKLENEVGPVTGVSAKMARGIVSRLSIAGEVQKLCCLAIEKAEDWLCSIAHSNPNEYSLPTACRFQFEDVTSSSLVIVLKETNLTESNAIKGYKLWYFKSREQPPEKVPVIFPRNQRRILISSLQPCSEYTFRIVSFTESGDFGHSESKCFTRSVEIIHKSSENSGVQGASSSAKRESKLPTTGPSGFKVRDLGKILRLAWAQEHGGPDGFCSDCAEEESCGVNGEVEPELTDPDHVHHSVSCGLNLNVLSALDMNAEFVVPIGDSQGADNGCNSDKNGLTRSGGSDDSQTCAVRHAGEVPAVESNVCRKRAAIASEEIYDSDSTLVNVSPPRFLNRSGRLDDYYEYCVKVVRWLECGGHIGRDFRMKFLTWFSLRSSEQERRVVHTFINTLVDDPGSLAGQLVDSFSGIITCKRLKGGSSNVLWH